MGSPVHPRDRHRLIRALLLAGTLTATTLVASPIAASAGTAGIAPTGITGCILTAKKPAVTPNGLKAFGRFSFVCIYPDIPFQYQVAVWEQDDGPDVRLSRTAWLDATTPSSGSYNGKGPNVTCNTERGTEELYTKVRVRFGGETSPWKSSAVLTTKTCQ